MSVIDCPHCSYQGPPSTEGNCRNCSSPVAGAQVVPGEMIDMHPDAEPERIVAGFVELLRLAEAGMTAIEAQEIGERAKRTLLELTAGYDDDPNDMLRAPAACGDQRLVSIQEAGFASLCARCLLRFEGVVTIASVTSPERGSRAIGGEHLRRLVRCLSRRLQTEDSLAEQAAAAPYDLAGAGCSGAVVRATRPCTDCGGATCTSRAIRGEPDAQVLAILDRAEIGEAPACRPACIGFTLEGSCPEES